MTPRPPGCSRTAASPGRWARPCPSHPPPSSLSDCGCWPRGALFPAAERGSLRAGTLPRPLAPLPQLRSPSLHPALCRTPRGDMAHAPARCPSTRGSGDGEMGKPRKVALITGITGQVSARRGRTGPAAAGHVCTSRRPGLPAFREEFPGRFGRRVLAERSRTDVAVGVCSLH